MIATVVLAAQSASADFITADWESTCPTGFWTDITPLLGNCWGAEPMPNNGNLGHTYHAVISDGNAIVTMNIDVTLDGLIILGNGSLNTMIMQSGRTLTLVGNSVPPIPGSTTGNSVIDGVLLMQSLGNFTDLQVSGGPFGSTHTIDNFDGSGEIRMSDNLKNRIYGATGIETIIFGSGLTVGGSGQIGVNVTTLINEGIIVADQITELQVNPSGLYLRHRPEDARRVQTGTKLRSRGVTNQQVVKGEIGGLLRRLFALSPVSPNVDAELKGSIRRKTEPKVLSNTCPEVAEIGPPRGLEGVSVRGGSPAPTHIESGKLVVGRHLEL